MMKSGFVIALMFIGISLFAQDNVATDVINKREMSGRLIDLEWLNWRGKILCRFVLMYFFV